MWYKHSRDISSPFGQSNTPDTDTVLHQMPRDSSPAASRYDAKWKQLSLREAAGPFVARYAQCSPNNPKVQMFKAKERRKRKVGRYLQHSRTEDGGRRGHRERVRIHCTHNI